MKVMELGSENGMQVKVSQSHVQWQVFISLAWTCRLCYQLHCLCGTVILSILQLLYKYIMDHSLCFKDLSKDVVLGCLKVFKQVFFLEWGTLILFFAC